MSELETLKRWAVLLLITVAVAMACGRVACTELLYEPSVHRDDQKTDRRVSLDGEEMNKEDRRRNWPPLRPRSMPTFSSNDRSRWATVRALVDDGTYVVGRRDLRVVAISAVAPLGQLDPLAAAALAEAGYHARVRSDSGILFQDGWGTIDRVLRPDDLQYYSSKPPLLSTLVAGLYWLLKALFGWGLNPNDVASYRPAEVVRTILVLINVIPFGLYLWLLARTADMFGNTETGKLTIITAGAFATLVTPFLIAFNNHTVGTFSVMAAWYALLRIWSSDRPGWHLYVAAGFFAAFAACNELPALAFAVAVLGLLLWLRPRPTLLFCLPAAAVPTLAFLGTNYLAIGQLRPAYDEFGSAWYEYEGSHWRKPAEGQVKHGIDWARTKETRVTYAFNVLLGHHGLFSLAPIWLLAVYAMLRGSLGRRSLAPPTTGPPRELPAFVQPLVLWLTVVVVGFYLFKSDNYGGWTNGPRWLMWLTPLWLTCLIPLVDRLGASRAGRALVLVTLAMSIFSAHYDLWNPWRHPWLYDLRLELGWPGY